jgi:hypothetical protein
LRSVGQAERDADSILAAHSHKTVSLLRDELAAVVSSDVRRPADILYEHLKGLAREILGSKQIGKMPAGVIIGEEHRVVETIGGRDIERTLKVGVHQTKRVAGARQPTLVRPTANLASQTRTTGETGTLEVPIEDVPLCRTGAFGSRMPEARMPQFRKALLLLQLCDIHCGDRAAGKRLQIVRHTTLRAQMTPVRTPETVEQPMRHARSQRGVTDDFLSNRMR